MESRALSVPTRYTTSARVQVTRLAQKLVLYLVAISLATVLIFPLFWMVSTSLKTDAEANAPKPIWVPAKPQLDAYQQLLADKDWRQNVFNSVFVTTLAVAGTLVSVTIVAFAFSRLQWPGRNLVFFLMMGTLMLPFQATLVPQYVLFNELRWIDTFNPITIPGYFAGGAAMVFLLRQFMLSIPKELDEAALVDGASYFQIFRHIIVPNSRAAIVTVGLFLFIGQWNALQLPLIYLQSKGLQTLPMAILSLYNPQSTRQPWTLIMATSLVAVLPLILVFLIVQRYYVESIVLTGTKE